MGLLSCVFRQNNIVWFAYIFGVTALHAYHYPPERAAVEENLRKPLAERNRDPTAFVFDHDILAERSEFCKWTCVQQRLTLTF